jgi:putative phosphoribosyl transferase
MRAAVEAVRAHRPSRVVVAVPVGAPETCQEFADVADDVVCARTPRVFSAVGLWYRDFSETTDEEVKALLRQARGRG